MFNALNKIDSDEAGVSKSDLEEGFKFQQFFIKQGLNPLTKEIRVELMVLADNDLVEMLKWSDEVNSKAKAAEQELAKPAERAAMVEAFKSNFAEADADNDKYLSQPEYLTFCAKMQSFLEEKGLPVIPQTEEHHTRMWTAMNKISNNHEGISPEDIGLARRFQQGYIAEERIKKSTK